MPAKGMRRPRIGIVAMQGDYDAHRAAVTAAGGDAVLVRTPDEAASADGLILPGGESTTIGRLMARYGLDAAVRDAHAAQTPIYGTCAGMILLAREIVSGEKRGGQPTLGLMDIGVARNAWGRQIDSFETDMDADDSIAGDTPLRGVFIRAPSVETMGPNVEVLARFDGKPVLVRQGNLLASAFHPELTGNTRVHRYFLQMVGEQADEGSDTR